MDFFTTHAAPIVIRVNGTSYTLPRFLLPQIKAWGAERRQKTVDEATAHLSDDDKARFLMYFQSPYIDVLDVAAWAVSTDGADEVCARQMRAGGVPDELVDAVIAQCGPVALRNLAEQLCSADSAAQDAKSKTEGEIEPGKSADPLSVPSGESAASPGIGQKTSPSSATSTAA